MKRNASAVWHGSIREGKGSVSTETGALKDHPYSFGARFEETARPGTNPEELIASAHAGCFTMALSGELGKAGYEPEELRTEAAIELVQGDGGWNITSIHLSTRGRVPGIEEAEFQRIADGAKAGCPVSRALAIDITLDARLEA